MSTDLSIVVVAPPHTFQQLCGHARAAGATLHDAEDEVDDADPDDADLAAGCELQVTLDDGRGGVIEIDRLPRGYRLSIDGMRNDRASLAALGELLVELGVRLGEVVNDPALELEMVDEAGADEALSAPERLYLVVLELRDRDDIVVESAALRLADFHGCLDRGGMPSPGSGSVLELFAEDHRFANRAAKLVAVSHDIEGRPMRRHTWRLDGYGRIVGLVIDELALARD